ncbi:uncharacterized protein PG986_011449 [Apiospora aurea]|uniref:F-box domain-containing protein n=1 Tax=Apiospora aurea TaxID=335848 RepID=A0ABR1Q539_9PEZI
MTQPSDSTMSIAVPCNAPSPFDLLLELPIELFDLVIEKLPVPSQVALSITCHAARKLLKRHLKNLDWTSFRREWSFPFPERPVPAVEEDCREFLRDNLGKDLADQFVYCGDCVTLHRVYDAATELSQDFKVPTTGLPTREIPCRWRDAEPRWLFDDVGDSFSLSRRQVALVERHFLHGDGRGIPAHRFCKETETPRMPVSPALWKLLLSPDPSPAGAGGSNCTQMAATTFMVGPWSCGTSSWCPTVRTRGRRGSTSTARRTGSVRTCKRGEVSHHPLLLGGERAPGADVVTAGVDPVFDGKSRPGIHCQYCRLGGCWKVGSGWLTQANDLQHDGSAAGEGEGGGSGDPIGIKDDEGTVCVSLAMRTLVI